MELIDVTARALMAIGFRDFTVHINDRRLLRQMLEGMGLPPTAWIRCASALTSWIRSEPRAWLRNCGKNSARERGGCSERLFGKGQVGLADWPDCVRTRAWATMCAM